MEVKVSVIVPVYNTEKYLRECVDSILNQTFRNFELIFVDDGSTDNSVSILEDYQKKDSRIKIIKQRNQHAGVARNNGMKEASGKYLFFLDSDDFFEPKMFEKCVEMAEKTYAEIVGYNFYRFDDKTKKRKACKQNYCNNGIIEKSRFLLQKGIDVPWLQMFSKSFIDKYGLQYQGSICNNDVYFCRMAIYLAKTIAWIDSPFVNYRINNSSSLQGNVDRDLTCATDALIAIRSGLVKYNLCNSIEEKNFYNYCNCSFRYNFSTRCNIKRIEEWYNFTKSHLIPDIFPSPSYISDDSIEELIYKSDSCNSFIWEQFKKNEIKNKQDVADLKQSPTFKLGSIILFIPSISKKWCKKVIAFIRNI